MFPCDDHPSDKAVFPHRDDTATTADSVRLASAVAGRDPAGFPDPRLHGATTPPAPGHPQGEPAPRAVTPAHGPGAPVHRPGEDRE
ncbi:predicted protein [Streptomyces viridosporus ATCC 14672]|uniref:Predicted protein n=1 Tax=Streptomyces viridosporus (strain ATCC 14672 / DSM 40746 / JCM 4963 / KCTC 9882 / NRRL B-12104 / FH 1290) TaxID=566461 RepID=D5ZT09_STRV1|nr:predicted protein [Streptomyces viridosporus ATCC 14672]